MKKIILTGGSGNTVEFLYNYTSYKFTFSEILDYEKVNIGQIEEILMNNIHLWEEVKTDMVELANSILSKI